MSIAKQIIIGHSNELLNKNEDLFKERIAICKKCALYKKTFLKNWFGEICDANKYLNPKTNETSYLKKDGWFRGCNCRLDAKTRVRDAKCPAGKW